MEVVHGRYRYIFITEYVIVVLLRFLAADHDGGVVSTCVDSRVGAMGEVCLSPCHLAFAANSKIQTF